MVAAGRRPQTVSGIDAEGAVQTVQEELTLKPTFKSSSRRPIPENQWS